MNDGHINNQHGDLENQSHESHIRNKFRYVLNELRDKKGSLLVIGSGDGSFESRLGAINPDLTLTSIDINDDFREKLAEHSDTVIIDDFLTYTFDTTYDFIVCIDVIEHMIETDIFFTQAMKALADSGRMYLQTPNLASWHGRMSLLLGYTPEPMEVSNVKHYFGKFWFMRGEDAIHHVRIFSYRAIREMSSFYGFNIVKAVGTDHRAPSLFKHFPSIAAQVCLTLEKSII